MKVLHLMRHAKSAWDEPGLSDRERGLNKRGRRAAPRMGAALACRESPLVVAVSPARRAQLTLAGLCDGWPELAELEHQTVEDLYTFDSDDLQQWLRRQPNNHSELFIIGHNPALTDLINELVPDVGLVNLPTAGYVQLRLALDQWSELGPGVGTVAYSLFPRQLAEG